MQNERRLQLHELNTKAWSGAEVFPVKSKKLDSSIKRNTGFIKKLKQGITKDSKASLLKDLSEVSLEKYLSEVVNTAAEGLSNVSHKNEDVSAAVEVVSGLHQRFNSVFTCKLLELFLYNFANPPTGSLSEKDEVMRVNKVKSNLRVFTELYLVGIFTTLDDIDSKLNLPAFLQRKFSKKEPLIFTILKEVLNSQFKLGFTVSIATSFVKKFPNFFDHQDTTWDELICDNELKPLLKSLFKVFTDAVFARASDLHKKIGKLLKEHEKCQIRTGKVGDEFLEEYEILLPIFERFKLASFQLAEFFELEAPELKSESENTDLDHPSNSPVITNITSAPGQRLWENDETRKFYELLPDVSFVYGRSVEDKAEASGAIINQLFSELENAETKEMIDNLSMDYWRNVCDNKATRKRLVKFLIETQDWSKLRIYARFLATNGKYFPDIIEEVIAYLDNGFRHQLHSSRINVKNIIFFSEMVKFMLIPSFMIFHKIRTLIINLQVPNNVEILTVVFEHLGIFLINKTEYKSHMEKMMEIINDKKTDRQLNMNLKSSLENLINLVYPPSISQLNVDAEPLKPEQHFYHILLRRELQNFEFKTTLKLLRKANWQDEAVSKTLIELFSKPEYVSYQNIPLLARLLKELYVYHKNFVVICIDEILESIERGLEINDYSLNMHRVAQVKYLTELYNFELIKPVVLVNTIYSIMNFRHSEAKPYLFCPNEFDLADNYFRIQLITTILLNVTRFPLAFSNKLYLLLRFLEYYIFTKSQPLPTEIQFKVEETLNKYIKGKSLSNFERSLSIQESATRLSSSVRSAGFSSSDERDERLTLKDVALEEESENEDEFEAEEDGESESDTSSLEDDIDFQVDDDGEDDEQDDDTDESDSGSSEDEDENDIEDETDDEDNYRDIDAEREIERQRMYEQFQKKLKDEEERKIEADLEKQFQQIMSDSINSRKNEKLTSGNIPTTGLKDDSDKPNILRPKDELETDKPRKVAFTFLSKSGKKTQSRKLELPSNIDFVSGVIEEGERLKSEREKIKNIVLQRTFD